MEYYPKRCPLPRRNALNLARVSQPVSGTPGRPWAGIVRSTRVVWGRATRRRPILRTVTVVSSLVVAFLPIRPW